MDDTEHEWLTRAQVAAALQVHVITVSRWMAADPDMRVRRLGPHGGRVRIHRSEIERLLTARTPAGSVA